MSSEWHVFLTACKLPTLLHTKYIVVCLIMYIRIAASRPFRLLVGPDKKSFTVHSELLAQMSKPLNSLVNGEMKEASDGVAAWPEVDEETFIRFWEFAYTRNYTVAASKFDPVEPVPSEPPEPPTSEPVPSEPPPPEPEPGPGPEPEPALTSWDASWDASFASAIRKKQKKMRLNSGSRLRPWSQFRDLCYEVPSPNIPSEEEHPKSRMKYSEVFHSHARMYVLADYYDIEALMMLSLKKLHQALLSAELSANGIDDVTVVLDYCFANTVDKGGSQDKLRHLLTLYAACMIEDLWPSPLFQELLERSGELSKAIIGYMIERL